MMNSNDFDFQNENIFNIYNTSNNSTKSKLPIQSLDLFSNQKPIHSEATHSGTELHTPSIYISDDPVGNTNQKNAFKWN